MISDYILEKLLLMSIFGNILFIFSEKCYQLLLTELINFVREMKQFKIQYRSVVKVVL
jgi:hypothetical protein